MKKNIKKLKSKNYAGGGQLFDTIGQLAPLLNLIPGVGQLAAPLVGMGASFLGNKARQKESQNNGLQATNYANANAFGYNSGGNLQSLNSTSAQVTGAPNQVDGNQINYKGQNINLNYGETLDTNKDRVISDKYINPETGKRIIDEDKRLKSLRGKAEKVYAATNDLATKNTIKRIQEQEDSLYVLQENIATMKGDRNTDGSTVQKGQKYAEGGPLQPKNFNPEILAQMQALIQQINKPQSLDTSTRPELFPEEVNYNGTQSKISSYPVSRENYSTGRPVLLPRDYEDTIKSKSKDTSSIKIKELQKQLVEKGYDNIGKSGLKNDIDGVFGSRTKAALRDAINSGKIDKSYESYLSLPSKQSSRKMSSKGPIADKVSKNQQNESNRSVRDEEMLSEFYDNQDEDYKWNTNIDWQKMMANSKQKPIYMPEPKKKKEKSIGMSDLIYGNNKYLSGGSLKSYAPGGYLDPLKPLPLRSLNSLGQVNPMYDIGTIPRSMKGAQIAPIYDNAKIGQSVSKYNYDNRPSLNSVKGIVSNMPQSTSNAGNGNMWSNMTDGEKLGLGSSALSVALKATDAFGKVQKEPYRYNNAPISLNALDPTAVLNNNQVSYESALNDLNNNSTTGANRQAVAANLFNNKLRANNDVLTKYGEQNSNLATQYEQRLAQRSSENNQMAYQTDDMNSRNKGAAQQMRGGVYGDLATLGLNQANVMNNRLSQNAQLEALKMMAPDVYQNYMKNVKLK